MSTRLPFGSVNSITIGSLAGGGGGSTGCIEARETPG